MFRDAWLIAGKDLRVEVRSRVALNHVLPLAVLMLVLFAFALDPDRGVLAILDPRLKTMGYGRRFLASLPPAPVTHDLDAVARFFM